jgi:predicted nucleic acid-binding protein
VIVLDTTVLVYAVGGEHPLRRPARAIVEAVERGDVQATTTVEVIQELVHVRARRRGAKEAAALGRSYADLLSPLVPVDESHLRAGLALFERTEQLGCFDAVLAAVTLADERRSLVSADSAFADVTNLPFVNLADAAALGALLAGQSPG